ncbi:transglutaminase family protein [Rubripirellula amarantea]|nr:transglutaminase family protein [Rubripirellula amarantea]
MNQLQGQTNVSGEENASTRYHISHRTMYKYSAPVAICQNQLRMMPRSLKRQTCETICHHVETLIKPEPTVTQQHVDYFGNQVIAFSVESLHDELDILVQSDVTVSKTMEIKSLVSTPWESVLESINNATDPNWLFAKEFQYNSPRIHRRSKFAEYAAPSFPQGRPIIEASLDLTKRIHQDFAYDSKATHVGTTTEESFLLRAGVCQDFSHVQIACLRSLGIPACYVSGYLRTVPADGKPRMTGADESHAWISVYTGPEFGWIDFDPTNACAADTNHIPICIGRDYSEVSPMRGVVIGGGVATLSVAVDVIEV